MNVFIAGARSIKELNDDIRKRLLSITQKKYKILIGDCYGVDAAVQNYLHSIGYRDVIVFATNGIARNNKGGWMVYSVESNSNARNFEYYKKKDAAMANKADCGLMIWNEESKGTLNNIIKLVTQNKPVMIYLMKQKKVITISSIPSLEKLLKHCNAKAQNTYKNLCKKDTPAPILQQVSWFGRL